MSFLHARFEEQVKRNPELISVDAFNKKLSYQHLSSYSNKIAHKFRLLNVQPNTLIAVVMEKGWEQVVAVLAILKAGAAFLPIDPRESQERLSYLLKIGKVAFVLTQKKLKDTLKWPDNIQNFAVDDDKEWCDLPDSELSIQQKTDDLAYVIFTSGTTGVPKGVMIDHRGAINTILDVNQRFKINEDDKIFAASALNFDLAVYDIFGTLFAGGTIVVPTDCESADPTLWAKIFLEKKVTVCNCVPPLFQILTEYLLQKFGEHPVKSNLRLVLLSGDWIPVTLPSKIRSLFERVEIISLGGATEASIWSILYPITHIDSSIKSIPYGKSMTNQVIYVLNKNLIPTLPGEEGELYIGGIGVAKGYWCDTERTQAAFIRHPFLGRLYKTGDLGRYLPDGNVEFLGRVDYQVKIRGYRVEIGAIESCLLEHPLVKQAAVISIGSEYNKRLIAYVILNKKYLKNNKLIAEVQATQWHEIHNTLAGVKNLTLNSTFNTLGWTSSFTGLPISAPEMEEWVNETIKRIMDLKPQKILEIGCGLGLLLFRIAPKVELYDAIDYAETAVDSVREQAYKLGMNHIHFLTCEAKDLPDSLSNEYDTIILNSVVQYFNCVEYFLEVINRAIDHLKVGGRIFIGDIRHLAHLQLFYAAVMLQRANQQISYSEWKNLIDRHVNNEEELLIDHRFFYALKMINPRISSIEIQLKRGNYLNEMTCFRYDVILYLDETSSQQHFDGDWVDWQKNSLDILTIQNILKEKKPEYLAIKNIYNKRTAGLEYIMDRQFIDSPNWLAEIKRRVVSMEENSLDPQELYKLGDDFSYNISITWSNQKPENFINVIYYKKFTNKKIISTKEETMNLDAWNEYVNLPIKTKLLNQVFLKIKRFLQTKLPNYMIPGKFISMDALPLNPNGKIDRKALPINSFSVQATKFVEPNTIIEKKIAKIWKNILQLDSIGVYDNFYEIGGTSLSAVMIVNKIEDIFSVHLSVAEFILHSPTIHSLVQLISAREKSRVTLLSG